MVEGLLAWVVGSRRLSVVPDFFHQACLCLNFCAQYQFMILLCLDATQQYCQSTKLLLRSLPARFGVLCLRCCLADALTSKAGSPRRC
jgi:hypothetical protein